VENFIILKKNLAIYPRIVFDNVFDNEIINISEKYK